MFNYAFLKTLDILYVESNEELQKHFCEMLHKQFRNVVSLSTASEAYEEFTKENDDFEFNIIICNTNLSDCSGLDFLKKIRQIDSKIPFIFTSEKIEIDGLLKAIEYKADDYLQEPVNAKDLVFTVERICQNIYFEKTKFQSQKDLEDIREVVNEVALVSKTNLQGEITFVNKLFCKISAYDESELLGKDHGIIKSDTTNNLIFEEINKQILKGKIWEGKLKYLSKDQVEFYVYTTVIPVFYDNSEEIKEFIWIYFLATQDELEQKEFKKKVAKNIHANRRINTEARNKIDELINKLNSYKNMESNIINEKQRASKFLSQIKFYETEVSEIEEKLKETSQKASVKIKKVLADEKEVRQKRDKAAVSLDKLSKELDAKNKDIKVLTKELDEQIKIIEKLMRSIDSKESEMGMN